MFSGCEYGDRSTRCSRSRCSDPANWRDCCYTCQSEIEHDRRTTTRKTTTTTKPTTIEPTTITTKITTTTTKPTTVTTKRSTVTETEDETCLDKADYCSTLYPGNCYINLYKNICCKRCQKYYQPIDGKCFGEWYYVVGCIYTCLIYYG